MATSDELIHVEEGSVFWTPEGGAEVEIDVKTFTVKPKMPIAKVLGSKYGRQNIAGTGDLTGDAEIYLRRDEFIYSDLQITPGAKGTLRGVHYDGGPEWSIPIVWGEEFTETIFQDSETDVKVIGAPFLLDGVMPDYPDT